MIVEYASENDISFAIEKISPNSQALDKEKGNNGNIMNSSSTKSKDREKTAEGIEKKSGENTNQHKGRFIIILLDYTNSIDEPIKTLDSLFKKTVTKPYIYYLPLSDDEVIYT